MPIIPAGFAYLTQPGRRTQVTLRFGAPLVLDEQHDAAAVARVVEEQVRALSAPALDTSTAPAREVVPS